MSDQGDSGQGPQPAEGDPGPVAQPEQGDTGPGPQPEAAGPNYPSAPAYPAAPAYPSAPAYPPGSDIPSAPAYPADYQPPAPPGLYLDQASGLYLPDGTQLATVGRRVGAFFLGIVLPIVTLGIGYVIWGAIVWSRGQTPTFQVLRMRCWRPETQRVAGWWWMALREIIGRALLDQVLGLITLLTSLILMLATRQRKALHDLVAGTVVLFDPSNNLA